MLKLNVVLWAATAVLSVTAPCAAATHRVPIDFGTIQQAVDAAAPGDTIRVHAGQYCGATIDKPLRLVGHGHPSVVGCAEGPALSGRRVGFLLANAGTENAASGTTIAGFRFDGAGVSNQDLEPLALGVFARFASDVRVLRNRFEGTVQAITNTAGDNWVISLNRISGLTLFGCDGGCAGGVGVAIQSARAGLAAPGGDDNPVNRAENNVVTLNRIEGMLPDGFDVFGMVGVLALAADGTVIAHNRIGIPDNPTAPASGQGILVTNVCCGLDMPYVIGSRDTVVVWNDGRKSEDAVVVEGADGANTEGLVLVGNRGVVTLEGEVVETLAQRARSHRGRRLRAMM